MAYLHFIYGLANRNEEEAWIICQIKQPNVVIPCSKHASLCEPGGFNKNAGERLETTPELEEIIRNAIEDPSKIALQHEFSAKTTWKVLKRNIPLLYH